MRCSVPLASCGLLGGPPVCQPLRSRRAEAWPRAPQRYNRVTVRKNTETVTELERRATEIIAQLLEGIARGERAFAEGRVTTHAQAKKRLGRWLDSSR